MMAHISFMVEMKMFIVAHEAIVSVEVSLRLLRTKSSTRRFTVSWDRELLSTKLNDAYEKLAESITGKIIVGIMEKSIVM